MTTQLINAKLKWYRSRFGTLTEAEALAAADDAERNAKALKPSDSHYMTAKTLELSYRAYADLLKSLREANG